MERLTATKVELLTLKARALGTTSSSSSSSPDDYVTIADGLDADGGSTPAIASTTDRSCITSTVRWGSVDPDRALVRLLREHTSLHLCKVNLFFAQYPQ